MQPGKAYFVYTLLTQLLLYFVNATSCSLSPHVWLFMAVIFAFARINVVIGKIVANQSPDIRLRYPMLWQMGSLFMAVLLMFMIPMYRQVDYVQGVPNRVHQTYHACNSKKYIMLSAFLTLLHTYSMTFVRKKCDSWCDSLPTYMFSMYSTAR